MTLVHCAPHKRQHNAFRFPLVHKGIDRIFDGIFSNENQQSSAWSPRIDVVEFEDKFEFTSELPGLSREDIKLEMQNNSVTISGEKRFEHEKTDKNYYIGERSYGNFRRSFQLPSHVDAKQINAEFNNGVLKIDIPKLEEAKPKQIEIIILASSAILIMADGAFLLVMSPCDTYI